MRQVKGPIPACTNSPAERSVLGTTRWRSPISTAMARLDIVVAGFDGPHGEGYEVEHNNGHGIFGSTFVG